MEDRNQDLPLIVSEILIEMQQIRQEMHQDREANQRLLMVMIEESQKNTERMLEVFNRGFDLLHQRIDKVDERLERVEDNQTNNEANS